MKKQKDAILLEVEEKLKELEEKGIKEIKLIRKLISDDELNKDQKTGQYLGRFTVNIFGLEDFENEIEMKDFEDKLNDYLEKIKESSGVSYLKQGLNKIKNKIKELYYLIIKDIPINNYTYDLDTKILELIVYNLPKYTESIPVEIDVKQWELIKAKLVKLARNILDEYILLNQILDKYSMEWCINLGDGRKLKLTYWLISKEEEKKIMKKFYKEIEKAKEEFSELLKIYLFALWD